MNNTVRYIDIDATQTHLENLIQIADKITYKEFLIETGCSNPGDNPCYNEAYIDERTHRDRNGIFIVKPIAENEKFFLYICPYCKKIHIESKRYLFNNKVILDANCNYRHRLIQKICLIAHASPLAQENIDEVPDEVMKAEWEYMKAFNSISNVIDMDRR